MNPFLRPLWSRRSPRNPYLCQPESEKPAEAVIGYRTWGLKHVKEDHPLAYYLTSTVADYTWEGPIVRGGFDRLYHSGMPSPMVERHAEDYLGFHFHRSLLSAPDCGVVGRCTLFGKIIEGTDGYRAECCRIDALWVYHRRPWEPYTFFGRPVTPPANRFKEYPFVDVRGNPIVVDREPIYEESDQIMRECLGERYQCDIVEHRYDLHLSVV